MLEKPIYWGELAKRGAWIVCGFKRGLGKKEGVMFFKGEVENVFTL